MKKFIALTVPLIFLCFVLQMNSCAQAYIKYSLQGGSNASGLDFIKVVNGEAYIVQYFDLYGDSARLKKHAANGALLYSLDIPMRQSASIQAMEIINGEVYLLCGKPRNSVCCG